MIKAMDCQGMEASARSKVTQSAKAKPECGVADMDHMPEKLGTLVSAQHFGFCSTKMKSFSCLCVVHVMLVILVLACDTSEKLAFTPCCFVALAWQGWQVTQL